MVRQIPLSPSAQWIRLELEDADWATEAAQDLVHWYGQMLLIRRFEEKLLDLEKAGLIHGPAHASIGQEAGAVGAMSALGAGDKINGTHRAHHQVLLKLLNPQVPQDFDIRSDAFTSGMDEAIYRFMAEIMGLAPGYCGGRGGSMHMRFAEAGVVGTSAIVGGNPPHAVGYALADKMLGRSAISVAFFGDGAAQNGASYEAMNIAAAQSLPVIFFIENNLYGVSTRISEVTRETRLSSRGAMLGIAAIEVDGMDVVAVHQAMKTARDIIEKTGGPVVIEARCYRHLHQSGSRSGSDFGYRSKEEEAEWRSRDPLALARARLTALGHLSPEDFDRIDEVVTDRVAAAAARLTETTPGGNALRIPDRLWPDPASRDEGILGDLSELSGRRMLDHDRLDGREMEKVKFVQAASDVLAAAMERDPTIIVMGEDVHQMRGGVSGFTKGALERWPDRVLPMPIAENGFTGVALGAALNGLRPVVEIMFGDFCFTAADQIAHGVGKVRHMFGGDFPVPLVMRVRVSPHTGYGSQHSGDPSSLFALFPGWRIVTPSTAFDYIGLMNSALACNDPVVVIEHTELYQRDFEVPKGDRDYCIPFGKAHPVRAGEACTVLATSVMVQHAIKAAEETGIDAEIIDLRNIDRHGMDWELIGTSIDKTGRVIIAEQTARSLSMGGAWAGEIQERFFDSLDHEILHVTGGLAAPTVSAVLNRAALASQSDVREALMRIAET
ncbi:thiamine pyrophosphate-dependent enzyme [Rhizobium sp. SSA_523]|uniref:alpha-ketoacid dehydrogenase subunit alpha/beta n=1 Tax=Rhizobium sp. SSA_523 TaxID=2952477 RepID=UPI00209117C5|nr:alpha-ketoacid dehydrogenase subunit alpha/beta [Rhizobium sp. SSA_523]MCO5731498.1 thiamine pyrophosphate-dependent enzyme [Rhizobium sp. SSA_523]WKC21984.1 thiamine pyrophosphate-dependent enzyme [Rhizobium sp. SSA_523]